MGAGEERRKVAESGDGEEEDERKEEKGLEEVRWEKFLPRMPVRVLLVEGDDSTRQIIAALLRKCSYRGLLFLIFTPFVDSLDCECDSCPYDFHSYCRFLGL